MTKKKIAITGATGFIGKNLVSQLLSEEEMELICLSRSDKSTLNQERLTWKKCDLFSMLDIEEALKGCDTAIYLVHSMLPSAHLTQATFDNLDLILADNFARACSKVGIKHIIYLSGIIPESENLSDHLRSRLEVERTLSSYSIPTTTLRAGLILGPGGSSSTMVINLVKKLPIMALPTWTGTLSAPIAVEDVVTALRMSIVKEDIIGKTYDLGGPEIMSYRDLIHRVANLLHKKTLSFTLPFISQGLSKKWISTIAQAPESLVYPLIKSLKHHMVINPKNRFPFESPLKSIDDILRNCLSHHDQFTPHAYKFTGNKNTKEVRSVQRLETVMRSPATEVADLYIEWLPQFMSPFIQVIKEQNNETMILDFKIRFLRISLLVFHHSKSRSGPDRQLFYIRGGVLAHSSGRGRLEFRDVLDGRYTLAAIHEFRPKLPWYFYKYTQAIMHLWVMNQFNKYLLKKKK